MKTWVACVLIAAASVIRDADASSLAPYQEEGAGVPAVSRSLESGAASMVSSASTVSWFVGDPGQSCRLLCKLVGGDCIEHGHWPNATADMPTGVGCNDNAGGDSDDGAAVVVQSLAVSRLLTGTRQTSGTQPATSPIGQG